MRSLYSTTRHSASQDDFLPPLGEYFLLPIPIEGNSVDVVKHRTDLTEAELMDFRVQRYVLQLFIWQQNWAQALGPGMDFLPVPVVALQPARRHQLLPIQTRYGFVARSRRLRLHAAR